MKSTNSTNSINTGQEQFRSVNGISFSLHIYVCTRAIGLITSYVGLVKFRFSAPTLILAEKEECKRIETRSKTARGSSGIK